MPRMSYDQLMGLVGGDPVKALVMLLSGSTKAGVSITGADDPGIGVIAVTPNDSTDLTSLNIRMLRIGGAGVLVIEGVASGGPVTLSNVADGEYVPISPKRVLAATTCTGIVGII